LVLHDYIEHKGLFKVLYVDKAGIFGGPKRCNFSQVKRACEELGIEIIFANSAQGKGRIERSFDTFQDQTKITVQPQENRTEFTPVPKHIDLAATFVVKEYRKIRNDHTFSYGNRFYLIESPLRESITKQKIEIRTNQEAGFTAYFAGRELSVSEVKEPTKRSMVDMEIQKKLDVLELAESLGNVSEAAKISGVSRDTIYRHRRLVREGGITALKKQINPDHCHQNRTDESIANTVVEFSLDNPHLGQVQVSNHLRKQYKIELSATGVRNVWLRENMQTIGLRLQKKASLSALL